MATDRCCPRHPGGSGRPHSGRADSRGSPAIAPPQPRFRPDRPWHRRSGRAEGTRGRGRLEGRCGRRRRPTETGREGRVFRGGRPLPSGSGCGAAWRCAGRDFCRCRRKLWAVGKARVAADSGSVPMLSTATAWTGARAACRASPRRNGKAVSSVITAQLCAESVCNKFFVEPIWVATAVGRSLHVTVGSILGHAVENELVVPDTGIRIPRPRASRRQVAFQLLMQGELHGRAGSIGTSCGRLNRGRTACGSGSRSFSTGSGRPGRL